jgi:hypothetical protein
MSEIQATDDEYGRQILAVLESPKKLKAKAKGLGIALKVPEVFFRKQPVAIDTFK